MMTLGGSLTVLHVLIAFTPLYDLLVREVIGAPEEIIEPARIGLKILTPWTWFIAYRRFNQGILIRFERSRVVGTGTAVRLGTNILILLIGYTIGTYSGSVVGPTAVIVGVIAEAVYIGIKVQPTVRENLAEETPYQIDLTLKEILNFYIPLALTSLLFLLVQPIGSAALSRMPDPIRSLAVWPVISGLAFMIRSLGIAYNEVVVALLDRPRSAPNLRRFANYLAFGSTLVLIVLAVTPLATFWFVQVSGLSPELAGLAKTALWVALLWPAINVYQSWFQGAIVHSRKTRGIPEAVVVFLITSTGLLYLGVTWQGVLGLYMGLFAAVTGNLVQTIWLGIRSRPVLRAEFQEQTA
jgi:hypothetical protein